MNLQTILNFLTFEWYRIIEQLNMRYVTIRLNIQMIIHVYVNSMISFIF